MLMNTDVQEELTERMRLFPIRHLMNGLKIGFSNNKKMEVINNGMAKITT